MACLHRLHVEACRMGGDILYNLPRRAWPNEREMRVRAQVAHTRAGAAEKPEAPPAAASNEPVVPIGAPVPAPGGAVVDGGAPD